MGRSITQKQWRRDAWLELLRDRPDPNAPVSGRLTLDMLGREDVQWLSPASSIVTSVTRGSSAT
jgi:hypothetical protein